MKFIDRTGEENVNNKGTLMKIIKYKNKRNIVVEFQDEYKARVSTQYNNFKRGNVKNPYDKNEYGGYVGEGKYKITENRKATESYICWKNILKRCYDPYILNKYPTYIDCYVCDEWLCFQNFAKWYYNNIYECNDERMELDKDILMKGNKIYSPETCVFVPRKINILFTKSDKTRGEYPIGVCYCKGNNKLSVYSNNGYKKVHLGYFPLNKPFQAFYTYKIFKEKYIKQVADEYKNKITQKLYEALYKYEVEIND